MTAITRRLLPRIEASVESATLTYPTEHGLSRGSCVNEQMCRARCQSWWKVVAWSSLAVASGRSYRGVANEDGRYTRDVLSCDGGKNVLKVDRMNDDYCDCNDGLDEPGTSSCASVVTSETTFWCPNSGHVPKRISLSRVDDGICDCCDGADESYVACENSCAVEAAQAAAIASADSTIRLQGWRRRVELACDAVKRARRAEAELAKASTLINVTERMLEAAEADVATARARADKAIDADAKQRLLETFHLNTLGPDALLDLVLDLARETQAATQLKRLARLANGLPEHEPPEQQEPSGDEVMPSSSTEEATEEVIEEDQSSFHSPEIAAHAEVAAFLGGGGYDMGVGGDYPADIPLDIPSDEEDFAYADDDGDGYGEAAAGDAMQSGEEDSLDPDSYRRRDSEVLSRRERNALRKLNNRVEKLRSKLDKKQSKMDKAKVNVGEGEAFANLPADRALLVLSEKCLRYRSKTYVYEICFFAKAKQGSTRLGTFRRLETAGSQISALFDEGERCYKGPPRSLRVNFVCGVEDAIQDVDEPETCVYVATVATPTVCEIDDLDPKSVDEPAGEPFTCDDRRDFSIFQPLYEFLNLKISIAASWFGQ